MAMPWACARPSQIRRSAGSMPFCTSRSSVRTVPRMLTVSGITFQASPAWNWVTLTTTASVGAMLRLAMVWSVETRLAPATIGSRPRCGMAAWEPSPVTAISKVSMEAMTGPITAPMRPDRKPRPVVHPVHRRHGEAVQQSLLHHHPAASGGFLRRLEDEIRCSVEPLGFGQIARCAQQHGGVAVVAAGMHLARSGRFVGDVVGLIDRKASMSARRPIA